VGLDGDAIKVWTSDIYEEFTTFDNESAVSTQFIQRAAPYCRRIAALEAALAGRSSVTADDIRAAAAAVRYAIGSARYVLGRTSRNPDLDKIRRAVGGAGADGLSRSEISALFSRNKPVAALDALLAELMDGDGFEKFLRKTQGRPAEAYRQVDEVPGTAA
jgi:Mg-chelatase subunit ChlI